MKTSITGEQCLQYRGWESSTHVWCEEKICSWIREPANAWSNLSFILVGVWIFLQCRRQKYGHLRLLGIFSVLIGLMSGFYHASSSFIGEVFDYSAMFLVSTFFLCANLARLYRWNAHRLRFYAALIFMTSVGGLVYLKSVGAMFFGMKLVAAFGLEYKIYMRSTHRPVYRDFLLSCLAFLVAWLFWNLDRLRILCDPENHILTGHAVWHILNAVAVVFIYRFYSQFELKNE